MPHSNAGTLLALDRVVAIAHRGGARLRPENTVAAFDHALLLGADAIECDVHLSADGQVVVIHDSMLDRTTDGTGPVASRTAAELAQVDAGYRYHDDGGFPWRGKGIGVSTLGEVLDRYSTVVPIIVEIKGAGLELVERTVAVIRTHGAASRVIVAGFSHAALDYVRRLAPELVTSAPRSEVQSAMARSRFWLPLASGPARVFQVPFRLGGRPVLGERFVRAARRHGIPVHAWVVDEVEDMDRLIRMGITGLISDRPDLAVKIARLSTRPSADRKAIGTVDEAMMRGENGS